MKSLIACENPVGTWWQLGVLPSPGYIPLLLGWITTADRIDSGIPTDSAAILARAMTSVAGLTFAVSEQTANTLADHGQAAVRRVGVMDGIAGAVKAVMAGRPAGLTLLSTRAASTAVHMFSEPAFPWWLQGQVGLLKAGQVRAPELGYAHWVELLNGDITRPLAALRAAEVLAVIRPGVDGDIAGVFSLTGECHQDLVDAFTREAQAAGCGWSMLSEADFADRLPQ